MSKPETDQGTYDGTLVINSVDELKALFEVETDEVLADVVWNVLSLETDVNVDYDDDTVILIFGTIGPGAEFPMTLDHVWEKIESTYTDYEESLDQNAESLDDGPADRRSAVWQQAE